VNYGEFFENFGGSARTKNLQRIAVEAGDAARRLRYRPLPDQSGLPPDFIRLCPWEMEYLFAVAHRARRGIVETGRYNGGSCFLLACAAPDVPIHSIDCAPRDDELLLRLFKRHGSVTTST